MTLIPGELYLATDDETYAGTHILITVAGPYFFVDSHGVYYGSDDGIHYTTGNMKNPYKPFVSLKKLC